MSTKRSLVPGMAFGWTVGSIAALGALLGLLARPADADIAVYVSHDGVNRGIRELTKDPSQQIKIWIEKDEDMGTSVSPCSDVAGDNEVTGWAAARPVVAASRHAHYLSVRDA